MKRPTTRATMATLHWWVLAGAAVCLLLPMILPSNASRSPLRPAGQAPAPASDSDLPLIPAEDFAHMMPATVLALYQHVPADTLMPSPQHSNNGAPGTSEATESAPAGQMSALLRGLSVLSPLSPQMQGWVDALRAFPLAAGRRHAVGLLDLHLQDPSESSTSRHVVARAGLALLIHTGDDRTDVLQTLQAMVTTFSREGDSTLTQRDYAGITSQRLVNRKLPTWSVLEWGALGNVYAICLGEGAFESLVRVHTGQLPALSADSWYRATERQAAAMGRHVGLFVDLNGLRDAASSRIGPRALATVEALGLAHITHVRLALGHARLDAEPDPRAVGSPLPTDASASADGGNRDVLSARPVSLPILLTGFIPETGVYRGVLIVREVPPAGSAVLNSALDGGAAARTTVWPIAQADVARRLMAGETVAGFRLHLPPSIRCDRISAVACDLPRLVRSVSTAYMRSLSPIMAGRVGSWWTDVSAEWDVDFEQDLVNRLGGVAVVHNGPLHPLRWKFAQTIHIAHDGNPSVARAIHAMMTRWQTDLAAIAQRRRRLFNLRLIRTGDRWTLPLAGALFSPTLRVRANDLILTWSPQADLLLANETPQTPPPSR